MLYRSKFNTCPAAGWEPPLESLLSVICCLPLLSVRNPSCWQVVALLFRVLNVYSIENLNDAMIHFCLNKLPPPCKFCKRTLWTWLEIYFCYLHIPLRRKVTWFWYQELKSINAFGRLVSFMFMPRNRTYLVFFFWSLSPPWLQASYILLSILQISYFYYPLLGSKLKVWVIGRMKIFHSVFPKPDSAQLIYIYRYI